MPAQQINPLPGSVQQQGGQVLQRLHGGTAVARVRPTTGAIFYVRKTGSDTNGGSSASTTPDAQGTDGVTNGTTTFTAATGTFAAGDVNKLIMIGTKNRYRIVAVGGPTSITLSGSPTAGSGLTWKVGGAVLTLTTLMSTAAGASPAGTLLGGDRIYIGAGTYRENNIMSTSVSFTFEFQINGDVTGEKTGDPGMVCLSAWTTDDKTVNSQSIVTLASKNNYTFQNIYFVGCSSSAIVTTTGTTANLKFVRCAFTPGLQGICCTHTTTFQLNTNIQYLNCYFGLGTTNQLQITLPTGIGSHYDAGILIQNCLFMPMGASANSITVTASGSLAGRGGGVRILGNTFTGSFTAVNVTSANVSNTFPVVVRGCLFLGCNAGVSAITSGTLIETGNGFAHVVTPRTAVSVGAGSLPGANSGANTSWATLIHFGQEAIWGAMPRWYGEPMAGSPFLGFGVDNGGVDLIGRPRPAGQYSAAAASSAAGALQRGNTATADPAPIGGGTTPILITGPGFEDFYVPVPARAITVSCSVRFTGSPARLEVLDNPTIGVLGQSVVAAGLPNVVQTVMLAPFTPTAGGRMVIVRIYNPDPSGTSVLEVDDFLVTG